MSELTPETPESAAAEPVETAEAPSWAGPSQDDWTQLSEAVGYLATLEQQRAQVYAPQQPGQQAQIDPFADDFQTQLDRYIEQRLQPVHQFQTEAQLAEAEERANDILTDLATKDGEFDTKLARIRADHLLPAMQARYGNTPKAAEAALEAAAREQREYEQQMYQNAVARHTNHIATLAGSPAEPGSTYTVGVQTRTMPDYRNGGRVTDRFFGPERNAA